MGLSAAVESHRWPVVGLVLGVIGGITGLVGFGAALMFALEAVAPAALVVPPLLVAGMATAIAARKVECRWLYAWCPMAWLTATGLALWAIIHGLSGILGDEAGDFSFVYLVIAVIVMVLVSTLTGVAVGGVAQWLHARSKAIPQ